MLLFFLFFTCCYVNDVQLLIFLFFSLAVFVVCTFLSTVPLGDEHFPPET